jgi:cold shock protein
LILLVEPSGIEPLTFLRFTQTLPLVTYDCMGEICAKDRDGEQSLYATGHEGKVEPHSTLGHGRHTSFNIYQEDISVAQRGTVKWFNSQKGFGFIQPEGGGNDVFVHISAVEQAGLSQLNENQKVSFETETGRNGKVAAVNLKVV